eukprot:Nitzschia sp. Nitz4//scaffold197_size40390//20741//21556//NITZ4_007517-RA/size40390-processed-gene-0.4-mRNA-1//1//CDS//3329540484//3504//frame0
MEVVVSSTTTLPLSAESNSISRVAPVVAKIPIVEATSAESASAGIDEVTEVTESEVYSQSSSQCSDDDTPVVALSPMHEAAPEPESEHFDHPGRVRRSILRVHSEPLLVKQSRGCWKCLPKPDMDEIQKRASLRSLEPEEDRSHIRRSGVSFQDVIIRSYAQTLGDNPSVSYGPPISLDWEYHEASPVTLDHYENTRKPRRTLRQLVVSYYTRKNVLTWQYGFSEETLREAKKQVKKERFKRQVTQTLLPVMHVEAALESARRKTKRFLNR